MAYDEVAHASPGIRNANPGLNSRMMSLCDRLLSLRANAQDLQRALGIPFEPTPAPAKELEGPPQDLRDTILHAETLIFGIENTLRQIIEGV